MTTGTVESAAPAAAKVPGPTTGRCPGAGLWLVVGVAGAVLALVAAFPVHPVALGGLIAAAAAVIAWRPVWLWSIVPAALPLLDLAPWSGRFFLDEYDLLLAVSCALAWYRSRALPAPLGRDRLLSVALALVASSYAVSMLRALVPWTALGADSFTNLLSPFNALRVSRGAAWALLLSVLARRHRASGLPVDAAFGRGLLLGLAGTVGFIVYERLAYTRVFDFADAYRVAGPFSAMHVGGAYVECYLVVALAFLVDRLLAAPWGWRSAAGLALLAGAVYSLMVTFSRGGYGAAALGLSIALTLGLALHRTTARFKRVLAGAVAAALAVAVAYPVLTGPFAAQRLAAFEDDLRIRQAQWSWSLGLIPHDPLSIAFGVGVGRFPVTALLASPTAEQSASYRLMSEDGIAFLRLGAGRPLYIEQAVATKPAQRYRLRVKTRAEAAGASLQIHLCEKWLLSSAECALARFDPPEAGTAWAVLEQPLDSGAVGAPGPWLARETKISVSNGGVVPIDLAQIELIAADGRTLLRNGRFEQKLDHWFFTSDHHLAWHTKSMPIGIAFDQGGFGLLAHGLLFGLAVARGGRSAWTGAASAAPQLAAIAGFVVIGLIDTLIDAPRFLMLWLLLCALAAGRGDESGGARASS